ncbi:MAG TPA: hypothetical protein VFF68_05560 [Anaerolineaceae bacterium]|nr:hypothetical protein [Anaerolineaceae bacterium]
MMPTYDDKGKIFTPVVSKKPVSVTIQTATHRITGDIHVRHDHRLKDELDGAEMFIAVTDAKIYDLQGSMIQQSSFLAVHCQQIIWLIPNEEE